MSLIGSLNAAVGGMNAQSAALNAISDNVANSQTVGFKQTDTSFVDYLTESSATVHTPGAVTARPDYTNAQQGAVTQVSSPTSLAVTGGGLFAVQQPTGGSSFSPLQYYTRAGDFTPNSNGYLVNSAGYALDGWPATNAAGTSFDTTALGPIKISQAPSAPFATSQATLAANLPATPPSGTTSFPSSIRINDSAGNSQTLDAVWSQATTNGPLSANPISGTNALLPNQWDLTLTSGGTTTGPLLVTFGTAPSVSGKITSITPDPSLSGAALAAAAAAVPTSQAVADPAMINLALNFGLGTQNVALNLGNFGQSNGVTQFAGSTYAVTAQSQNGLTQGNFNSVIIKPTGDVVINYDNGATATIAQIPLATFNNPNAMQQQNGQAFTATQDSGQANVVAVGTSGAGNLVVGAVESSNVDIATQFTQMIVAQRAYTANSKVVSTANQMMQDTLNMVQG